VVTRYSLQNARFLLAQNPKLLVVACNTASALALPAMIKEFPLPVIGVIEPGAKAAAAISRLGKIGVIGTEGTIRSGAYQKSISRARADAEVLGKACPLFVPLAEEGWVRGEVPDRVAREYLRPLMDARIDTLVLGCTHYPMLADTISGVLGQNVILVDSAATVAESVEVLLRERGALASSAVPGHHFFVTDVPDRFIEVGERFLGRPIRSVEQVDVPF
jgi:glutamate racemase